MRAFVKWIAVPIVAVAIVPFLADWPVSLGDSTSGVAYAKDGGGGGGGGGNGGGTGNGADSGGRGGGHGAGATDSGGRGAGDGGGRGQGSAGADHGGKGHDAAGVGHGHQGHGLGSAVSRAAHEAQQMSKSMSKQDLQEAGFRNRGEAVSTAVHEAQRAAREGEAAAEDAEVGSSDRGTRSGAPTGGPGTTTTRH